jgi:hypothetical protein
MIRRNKTLTCVKFQEYGPRWTQGKLRTVRMDSKSLDAFEVDYG